MFCVPLVKTFFITLHEDPRWAVFMPAIPEPTNPSEALFTEMQESVRKDVECAFGVLQVRWAITRTPGTK